MSTRTYRLLVACTMLMTIMCARAAADESIALMARIMPSDLSLEVLFYLSGSPDGKSLDFTRNDGGWAVYEGRVNDMPNDLFVNGDLVVKKDPTTDLAELPVYFVSVADEPDSSAKFWMFLTTSEDKVSSIREYAQRGLAREQAYRTYLQAGELYHRLSVKSPKHIVTAGAAYWYFTAAYELARRKNTHMRMDQKAIEAAMSVIAFAREDLRYKEALGTQWQIDIDAWQKMVGKAKRLVWKDYALVRTLSDSKRYEAALGFATYFQNEFEKLSNTDKLYVLAEYGVNLARIAADIDSFETRVGQQ